MARFFKEGEAAHAVISLRKQNSLYRNLFIGTIGIHVAAYNCGEIMSNLYMILHNIAD